MATLTAPQFDSTATQDPPVGAKLRVRREGAADQTVEIVGAKCTIGSSARCHVRLPASESQPLQCLLSLETGAAIATRWASGVLLNGRQFAKEPFQVGDTLSIGPWKIEWDGRGAAPRRPVSQRETLLRETIDFTPPPVAAPTSNLRTTELFVPAAPAAAPAAHPRGAAKTLLISSRQTDPFTGLLGPAKQNAEPAPSPPAEAVRPSFTSQAFEDRLVARLWTANYAARRRAASLAIAARSARARAAELQTAVADGEHRLSSERTESTAAAAALQSQLEKLRSDLTQAVADRDRLAAEIDALRNARPRTAPPDPRLAILAEAAEKAEREVAELREELVACNDKISTLNQRCASAESALTAATAAQSVAEKSKAEADRQLADLRSAADKVQAEALLAEQKARAQQQEVAEQEAAKLRDALAACNEQIATLREQCAAADAALATATGARDRAEKAQSLAEKQLADQAKDRTSAAEAAAEHALREQERRMAEEETARLREQLYACEDQIELLRNQLTEVEAGKSDLDEQLAAVQQQQQDWLAQARTLEQLRAEALVEMTSERDELQRQLDEFAAAHESDDVAPPAGSWPTPVADAATDQEAVSDGQDEFDGGGSARWSGWEAAGRDAVDAEEETFEADVKSAAEGADDAELDDAPAQAIAESPKPTPPAEPPAVPFTPPSFIDKYRHLLDDNGDAEPPLSSSRPILDEEHLSPSKSIATVGHDDDSDEALEAYMSNMMRRVRGSESTFVPASQAGPTPAQAPVASLPEVTMMPMAADEPEIELDANGMLRVVRKQQAPTDMQALRELANSTARTAIAHHHKRRHVQSAVTKAVVCAIASAASAYLMLTASGVDSPWFWSGCVTLVMAVASAAQLAVMAFQRLAESRRAPAKAVTPAIEVPSAQAVE